METLELATLGQPFGIKDRKGKVWKALPDITAAEALGVRKMADAANAEDGFAMINDLAGIVSRALISFHPEMTIAKVLKTFTPADLATIVARFLALSGRVPYLEHDQKAKVTKTTKTGATASRRS